jgi:hypothetical protein
VGGGLGGGELRDGRADVKLGAGGVGGGGEGDVVPGDVDAGGGELLELDFDLALVWERKSKRKA